MPDFNSPLGRKAKKLLDSEYIVWLTTIDSNLTPQPRPVWFVPDGDDILIYSQPHTHKVSHIAAHPHISLHFNTDREGGDPVIVMTGTATIDESTPAAQDHSAYMKKYKSEIKELDMSPEKFAKDYARRIRVKLTGLRGW